MISIVLAAGLGTRMRPLSYYIPKILLPVKGKPVINYILDNLSQLDVDTHYIVASDHIDVIERYLRHTDLENVKVVRGLGWETGGDLSLALEQIGCNDDAAVLNGDIITDVNMLELYNVHKKMNGLSTISVLSLDDFEEAKRFGRISLDKEESIVQFQEKLHTNGNAPYLVNTGFYIFDHRLLEQRNEYLIPRRFKLETELFPRLVEEGKLKGHISNINYWWDVGTIDSYLKAENFMINKKGVVPP